MDMEMLNKRLTLANVYAPSSGSHSEFFDEVRKEVVSMNNEMIIIGGDWSIALNPKIDTNQPSNVYRARSRKWSLSLCLIITWWIFTELYIVILERTAGDALIVHREIGLITFLFLNC